MWSSRGIAPAAPPGAVLRAAKRAAAEHQGAEVSGRALLLARIAGGSQRLYGAGEPIGIVDPRDVLDRYAHRPSRTVRRPREEDRARVHARLAAAENSSMTFMRGDAHVVAALDDALRDDAMFTVERAACDYVASRATPRTPDDVRLYLGGAQSLLAGLQVLPAEVVVAPDGAALYAMMLDYTFVVSVCLAAPNPVAYYWLFVTTE